MGLALKGLTRPVILSYDFQVKTSHSLQILLSSIKINGDLFHFDIFQTYGEKDVKTA